MKHVKKRAILLLCITVLSCFSGCGFLAETLVSKVATSIFNQSRLDKIIYGEWATKNESLFIMNEDGTCGWYRSQDDRKDNFYSGKKITVLRGEEALKELGIDKKEQMGDEFFKDSSTVFSVRLYFDCFKSDGVDKSDQLKKDANKWLMIKITDKVNKTAVAYDIEDDRIYELTKIK